MSQESFLQKLSSEIRDCGPMTFCRFMELALYDEEFGYYMTFGGRSSNGAKVPSQSQIGWDGDFFTAPYLHPILAKALVRQICEIDELLGRPEVFTVLEMGAGEGLLARDVLAECAATDEDLFGRLVYLLVERSPVMRDRQRHHLTPWINKGASIFWTQSLGLLGDGSVTGIVVSNELVDAFPVHRVRIEHGVLKEVFVVLEGDRFVEEVSDPSTPALEEFLKALEVRLSEGFSTEISLQAVEWMKNVGRVLGKGVVMTIDYGHTTQDYFAPSRKDGTLLCYYRHTLSQNPYERVGLQDITAHVNFSSLAQAGEESNLCVTGFTNLMNFLLGVGVEEMVEGLDPESEVVRSAAQLLKPGGMGGTFKILFQHKEMERPMLRGLQYRPFFEGVLMDVGPA